LIINHIWRCKFYIYIYIYIWLFVDVDGPFYVRKMVKIHHQIKFNYVINIYFKISKKLMLELFMCLMLELLELFLKFYSLGATPFFFWNLWFQNSWIFFVFYIFHWIFTIFFIFFPTRIAKLRKFETKKKYWWSRLIQLFKPKISWN